MKAELQYELDRARRQDLMQQAEHSRLVKASATPKSNPVLATVGRQMVKLGERLQGQDQDANDVELMLPPQYSYEAR